MIDAIIAGEATDEQIALAQGYDAAERKKLVERIVGTLDDSFEEAVLKNAVVTDLGNAVRQVRPVLAAGLGVDQSVGMVAKMCQASIDELEEAGAADTEEYEKQCAVLEALNAFAAACEKVGTTQGEDAFDTIHYEYRGEVKNLEITRRECEEGIAHTIAFLEQAYGRGPETDAFVKALDRSPYAARFIGTFGSESFFAYKHVGAPGEVASAASDAEDD